MKKGIGPQQRAFESFWEFAAFINCDVGGEPLPAGVVDGREVAIDVGVREFAMFFEGLRVVSTGQIVASGSGSVVSGEKASLGVEFATPEVAASLREDFVDFASRMVAPHKLADSVDRRLIAPGDFYFAGNG